MEKRTTLCFLSLLILGISFLIGCKVSNQKTVHSIQVQKNSNANTFFSAYKSSTDQLLVQLFDPFIGFRQAALSYTNKSAQKFNKNSDVISRHINVNRTTKEQKSGSFIVVTMGEYATVWHGATNSEAKIRDEVNGEWISFPCPIEKLKPWLKNHPEVEINDLYEKEEIQNEMEFSTPPGSRSSYPFPQFGKKDERHQTFLSESTTTEPFVNQMDEYSFRSEYGHNIKGNIAGQTYLAHNYLFGGSYKFNISAYDAASMDYRIEDLSEYELSESSDYMDSCETPVFRTQSEISLSRSNKIVTPLGDLGTLHYLAKGSSDSTTACSDGKTTSTLNKKGVNPNYFWRSDHAIHTDQIILQLYVVHTLKGYEYHTESIYDSWWGETLKTFSDDFVPTSRIELIQCALDIIDESKPDSAYLVHQSQTTNLQFQMVVEQLIRFYYEKENLSDTTLSNAEINISVR